MLWAWVLFFSCSFCVVGLASLFVFKDLSLQEGERLTDAMLLPGGDAFLVLAAAERPWAHALVRGNQGPAPGSRCAEFAPMQF